MLNFEYKGISQGKYVEGEIEALNNAEAAHKLKDQKVIITKLKEAKKKKVVVPTKTWKIIVFLLKIVPKIIFDILSSILAPGRYTDTGFKYGKEN